MLYHKIRLIADSSREQTTGIDQINQSIDVLEQAINQNATLGEELSSSAKNLVANARELEELLDIVPEGSDG